MKNGRGPGERILVTAGAARVSGNPVVEDGFFGYPATSPASGEPYWLDISQKLFEVSVSSGQTWNKGTLIYITSGNLLTSAASGNRLVGKVARVSADNNGPASGKVWLLTLPQQA